MGAKTYNLMPNESIIIKETNVAHGGVMAAHTDEVLLTNLNIVCLDKGILGNVKGIYQYPLSQIKRYNGKPQVIQGKLSNGTATLEVYMINGSCESFYFQTSNKKTINRWIDEINRILVGDGVSNGFNSTSNADDDYDRNTVIGAFREVGEQFKDVGTELLGAFGFKPGKKNTPSGVKNSGLETVSKKCISCSAPLVGYKGNVIKCRYCDTEQIL